MGGDTRKVPLALWYANKGTTFRNSITFDGLFSEIDLGSWKFAQAWLYQRLTEA